MNPLTLIGLLQDSLFLAGAGVGAIGAVGAWGARGRLNWFVVWSVAAIAALAVTELPALPGEAAAWTLGAALFTVGCVALTAPGLLSRTDGWVPPVLFALAVLGVWGTVPDTEHARVLMGVTASMLAAVPRSAAPRLGALGLPLASSILAYVVVVDGWPRDSAVVGACGAVGMAVAAPIALALRRRRGRGRPGRVSAPRVDPVALVGAQVLLVIFAGRVAGRASSAGSALGLLVVGYLAVGGCWLWWEAGRGRRRR